MVACRRSDRGWNFFFRFYHVDQKPIWDDEVVGLNVISSVFSEEVVGAAANFRHVSDLREVLHPTTALRPISDMVAVLLAEDRRRPPICYLIAHHGCHCSAIQYKRCDCFQPQWEYFLFRACTGCASSFLFAAAGLIGAALISISPVDVVYSREAREYSLWLVCTFDC